MKRDIIIPRPMDEIPGLIQVNSYLAERHGLAIAVVVDDGVWVGLELRHAEVVADRIELGKQILRHQLTEKPRVHRANAPAALMPIADLLQRLPDADERSMLMSQDPETIFGFVTHLWLRGGLCAWCGQPPGDHRQSDQACPRRAIARRLQTESKGTPS